MNKHIYKLTTNITEHGLTVEQANRLKIKIKQRKFFVGRPAAAPILSRAEFDRILKSTLTVPIPRLTEAEIQRWTKG